MTREAAVFVEHAKAGIYFDWWPDTSRYLIHIEKAPTKQHSEQFLEALGL